MNPYKKQTQSIKRQIGTNTNTVKIKRNHQSAIVENENQTNYYKMLRAVVKAKDKMQTVSVSRACNQHLRQTKD